MEIPALKALSFATGVIRTPQTDTVISRLDPYFMRAGLKCAITSVLRTVEGQLRIIKGYALAEGILTNPDTIMEIGTMTDLDGAQVPLWQVVWSKLLSAGILINPPVAAAPLFDYFRDTINKKGKTIQPSEHFMGTAFDIGGREAGVEAIQKVVSKAQSDGIGIRSIVLERNNNCVHCAVVG